MKFAAASSTNGRNQMRERHRRDRAATELMRTRFPQFASLRLDFGFTDDGPFTPAPQVTVLHPPARAYFVFPCPYADCDGEFDLTSAVTKLASDGEGHGKGQVKCCGQRSRDHNSRQPCRLTLEFTIAAPPETGSAS
jgi:hypothetical protein